jgi:hypothetical protein
MALDSSGSDVPYVVLFPSSIARASVVSQSRFAILFLERGIIFAIMGIKFLPCMLFIPFLHHDTRPKAGRAIIIIAVRIRHFFRFSQLPFKVRHSITLPCGRRSRIYTFLSRRMRTSRPSSFELYGF